MTQSMSLSTRISLIFTISAASILIFIGLMFEYSFDHQWLQHDMEELHDKLLFIHNLLGNANSENAIESIPIRIQDETIGHPGMIISLTGIDGSKIYSSGPHATIKQLTKSIHYDDFSPIIWAFNNHIYRIATGRYLLGSKSNHFVNAAIGLDITSDQKLSVKLEKIMWIGIILISLSSGLLSWVVIRNGLKPIHILSSLMAKMSSQELGSPIPIENIPADLRELTSAFNKMQDRLKDAFNRLSNFSCDLAHELGTPINNLILQTQFVLCHERYSNECTDVLHSYLEEFNRLACITKDMLFLAKADNHLIVPKKEYIDLNKEISNILVFLEEYANQYQVKVDLSGETNIIADRHLIQRALSNLLVNAIRHTPKGKTVAINIVNDATHVLIRIENPGQKISPEHLEKIFDRFYRVQSDGKDSYEHSGLGLSITKSIILMQGGTINVESNDEHTCFAISFPVIGMNNDNGSHWLDNINIL